MPGLLDRAVGRVVRSKIQRRYAVAWAWPSADEPQASWERVAVPTDGPPLAGLWGRAAGASRGSVVCAHPITRAAKGHFLTRGHSRALRQAGFDVLLFDFNGFGESAYRSLDYAADVLAAGHEAARRTPGRPAGFVGACFGATVGICAMARRGHPFSAAWLDTPYLHQVAVLESLDRHVERTPAYRQMARVVRLAAPLYRRMNADIQAPRVRGVRHISIVSAVDDTVVPPAVVRTAARRLREAAGLAASCRVWAVPGAPHLESASVDPDGYQTRLVACFRDSASRPSALV